MGTCAHVRPPLVRPSLSRCASMCVNDLASAATASKCLPHYMHVLRGTSGGSASPITSARMLSTLTRSCSWSPQTHSTTSRAACTWESISKVPPTPPLPRCHPAQHNDRHRNHSTHTSICASYRAAGTHGRVSFDYYQSPPSGHVANFLGQPVLSAGKRAPIPPDPSPQVIAVCA